MRRLPVRRIFGTYGSSGGRGGTDVMAGDADPSCPPATQDVELNLQNRAKAIQTAHYGPANPMLPNARYWQEIAREWRVTPEEAKTMRCGNCRAFDISPRMLDCIFSSLYEGLDEYDIEFESELGYCHAFKFKCAASRTCDAWIVGGPIT
jgi:hypothetical protein